MAIYRDTMVFCFSITGTENFQYHPTTNIHVPIASSMSGNLKMEKTFAAS